jgi:hypothetical protein
MIETRLRSPRGLALLVGVALPPANLMAQTLDARTGRMVMHGSPGRLD